MVEISIKVSANQKNQKKLFSKTNNKTSIPFKGETKDYNLVELLKQDKGNIFSSRKDAVKQALINLSEDGSESNVRFLLNVAKHLNYGNKKSSGIHRFITNESNIKNMPQYQNTDWEIELKSAITKAIAKSNLEDKSQLEKELNEVFSDKDTSIHHASKTENKILELRNSILNSTVIKNGNGTPEEKQSIKENLDFLVASSEISNDEKLKSLTHIQVFVSDRYKINEQLKDYKVKALSEILNDAILKRPDQERLTGKDVTQNAHGMCAAISQCRKLVPYETCSGFIKMVMNEINASPTMRVYDITDASFTKRRAIPKAEIDYKYAMNIGYRIIDAAALNWMHISHSIPGQEGGVGNFTAFDRENWGLFNDSHWHASMPEELEDDQKSLRAHIAAYNVVKSLESKQISRAKKLDSYKKHNKEMQKLLPKYREKIAKNIAFYLSKNNVDKAKAITNKILETVFAKQTIIHPLESDYSKKQKLAKIIQSVIYVPNIDANKAANNILGYYKLIEDYAQEEKSAKDLNNPRSKSCIGYYESLFKVAAFDRARISISINSPEVREYFLQKNNIPKTGDEEADKKQILKFLEQKKELLPKEVLDNMFRDFNKIDRMTFLESSGKIPHIPNSSDLFKYRQKYKSEFSRIQKSFPKTRKEIQGDYQQMNRELMPVLMEIYAKSGRELYGHFWCGEEGQSGLYTNTQAQNIERMTGEHYHLAGSVHEGIKSLKAGNPAQISYGIFHNQSGGHAECAVNVRDEQVYDEATGKMKSVPVLYMDNTWGPSEINKHSWISEGNIRTDYGGGRGFEEGYFVQPNYEHGVAVDKLINGIVINRPHEPGEITKKEKKLDPWIGSKSSIFHDIIVKGKIASLHFDLYEIIEKIKDMGDEGETVSELFDTIQSTGTIIDINNNRVRSKIAYKKTVKLMNKIKEDKSLNTREGFDKLDKDDEIRITAEKTCLIEYAQSNMEPEFADNLKLQLIAINSHSSIDKIKQLLIQTNKEFIKSSLLESEKYGPVNIEEMNSFTALKSLITTKFKPKTNKELMATYKSLCKKSAEEIDELLKDATPELLGIDFGDPYYIVQRIKARDHEITETVEDIVYKNIKTKQYHQDDSQIAKYRSSLGKIEEIMEKTENYTEAMNAFAEKYESSAELNTLYAAALIERDIPATLNIINLERSQRVIDAVKKGASAEELMEEFKPEINKIKQPQALNSSAELYNLFSYLNFKKYQKANQTNALFQYGALPSFPTLDVIPPEAVVESTTKNFETIARMLITMNNSKEALEVSNNEDLKKKYKIMKEQINAMIELTVKANVKPKKQNELIRETKHWAKSVIKDIENSSIDSTKAPNTNILSKATQEEQLDLCEKFDKYHITKHPIELLEHALKTIPTLKVDQSDEGRINTKIIEVWQEYLTQCYKAARLAEMETNMMELVSTGKMHKIGQLLKDSNNKILSVKKTIKNEDGSTSDKIMDVDFTSKEGIAIIINALSHNGSHDQTLKYFVQQTGLTEHIINTLTNMQNDQELFEEATSSLMNEPAYMNEDGNLVLSEEAITYINFVNESIEILENIRNLYDKNPEKCKNVDDYVTQSSDCVERLNTMIEIQLRLTGTKIHNQQN